MVKIATFGVLGLNQGIFGRLLLCCLKSPNFCLCTDVALALVKVLLHLNTGKTQH